MKISKTVLWGTLLLGGFCLVLAAYRFIALDGDLDGSWNDIRPLEPHTDHPANHPHMDSNSAFDLRECWFFCRYLVQSPQSMAPNGWGFMTLYDLTPALRRILRGVPDMPQDICDSECVFGSFIDTSKKVHIFIMDWQTPDTGMCPSGKGLCAEFHMVLLSKSDGESFDEELNGIDPGDALNKEQLFDLFLGADELEAKHAGSAHSGGDVFQ